MELEERRFRQRKMEENNTALSLNGALLCLLKFTLHSILSLFLSVYQWSIPDSFRYSPIIQHRHLMMSKILIPPLSIYYSIFYFIFHSFLFFKYLINGVNSSTIIASFLLYSIVLEYLTIPTRSALSILILFFLHLLYFLLCVGLLELSYF